MAKHAPCTVLWALLGLLLLPGVAVGQLQEFLLLEKPGKGKRIRYFIGDEITFRLYEDPTIYHGVLQQFSDSSFYIDMAKEVPVKDVEALIDRSKVAGIRRFGISTLYAIPAILVIGTANNLFNTGNTPIVPVEALGLSGVFLGVAGATYLYKGKRYRLGNRWRVIMVRH